MERAHGLVCVNCAKKAMNESLRRFDCPECGYKFQAVAVKFYADDDTSGIDVP